MKNKEVFEEKLKLSDEEDSNVSWKENFQAMFC